MLVQTVAGGCGASFIVHAASSFHISFAFSLPTTTPINSYRMGYRDHKNQAQFRSKYLHIETDTCANCDNLVGCPLLIYPLLSLGESRA